MKLRQTQARAESKSILNPSHKRKSNESFADGMENDEDNDVSFKEIGPFSPMPQQYENLSDDCNSTKRSDSLSDCDSKDNDWEESEEKSIRNRKTNKKASGSNVQAPIRKLVNEGNFYDIAVSDVVPDESMIDAVEDVLNLFPQQFAKAYCRYIFEEQNKHHSAVVLKKSRCKWRLYLVKNDVNKCIICGEKLKQVTRQHLKEHGGPTGFKCVCGKTSKSIRLFYEHITRIHPSESYCCPYCNETFAIAEQIQQHLKIKHNQVNRYTCAVCKKGIDKETLFLEHINSHTGLRPYDCTECDKKYRSAQDLEEHRRHHDKSVQVVCTVCGKKFVSRKLLNTHALIHGEVRKYACNICGKSFKTRQNLVHHQSFHSSEKSFTCSDCGASYSSKSALNAHFRNKHRPGSKKTVVGESTPHKVTKKKPTASKRKCAAEKPFSCSDCDLSYSCMKALNAHFRTKGHGNYAEKIVTESVYESANEFLNENIAQIENSEPKFAEPTPQFSCMFNSVVLSDEVKMFQFDSCEVNKKPLVLDKCIVADDMERDSDEESLFICL